jgi:serine/threonine-protein kinase
MISESQRASGRDEPPGEGAPRARTAPPRSPVRNSEELAAAHDSESFAETVAYQTDLMLSGRDDSATEPEADGFPEVDDLLEQTLGQYRLEAVVGRGSMGRVYRAQHLGLRRPCAVKVMSPGLVERQPQVREGFWAEARAVANLVHPHVVTIHNLGYDRGYHFIEMEYVPGGVSLKESIVREGPFDPIRASNLVWQVVSALGAAHESGLVHRDVKPANVLLTSVGHAKLADFGLVRHFQDLARLGVPVAGTPTFMAPELFSGVPASPSSDIYAVGVMYYYLLSGRLPFAADEIRRLVRLHRVGPIPDIRTVAPGTPDVVAGILERCLAKRPADRYANANALADDLETAVFQIRDTESLIRESLEGVDCFVQGGRDHFRVLFQLPGDRLQEVYLEVTENKQGERLLSVFSVCGPASPGHFEFALKLNAKLTYGSLSIRTVNGQGMFVMTRTFARDRACSADIRAALLEIARRADRVEQQLTNSDLY